jgi:RNA polymerase sigma-70 factor (ECF subfamily)
VHRSGVAEMAFTRAFDAHHDAVVRYCLRRLPVEDVDDAVARVFVVAWQKSAAIPSGDAGLAWLYRIARLEVSTMRRSARRWNNLKSKVGGLSSTDPQSAEAIVVQRSEHDAVLAALQKLSDTDREVVLLRSYEELPIAEIAVVMDCSTAAAAKRLSRALDRLRRAVGVIQPSAAGPQSAEIN